MHEAPSSKIAVNFLGKFSLEIAGHPVERWRAGRSRNLFQYLLVNKNKVVLKERLWEVLWPHVEIKAGSSALKVVVHALRRTLAGADGTDDERLRVLYQDFGYILQVDDSVWIDFAEFEGLMHDASTAQSRHELNPAAHAYGRAVHLYQGDFLLGESADWVDEHREWLRGSVLRALEFLARHALGNGDLDRALVYYRRSLEIDPCREQSYRGIMLVHGRRGEPGQVKRWYELCVRRMREQLDALPAAETERLLAASPARYEDLESELAAQLTGPAAGLGSPG